MQTASIISLAVLTIASIQCSAQQYSNTSALVIDVFGNQTIGSSGCLEGSECVTHYLCQNGTIIKDGITLIDIRFDTDDGLPKPCPHYLDVCCSVKDTSSTPVVQPPETVLPEGCGYRNTEGAGFQIIGDKANETQFGEFPWMVAVLKEEREEKRIWYTYQCGGSLIHPTVVLTAAHCVFGKPVNNLKARAGEWDTQTEKELYIHQDRNVVEIVTHENYTKGSLHNDIALLYVDTPFQLAAHIKTVCLPPPKANFDHSRCFATGWGKDVFGQVGKYQVILKKIDLPIVRRAECLSTLRTTRLGKHFQLHRSFICAGGEVGKDTCKGDGGSPLVCPIAEKSEQYYQAGIVAWGIGCGEDIPAVYASVAVLRDWVDEQLAYKKIDSKFYTP